MAKQIGFVKVSGTIGGITFYKLNGGYYARRKSSLDKERVLRDAAFAGSRRSSALFGTAAKIAKVVYRRMPIQKKGHGVIGKLTAKANGLLHEGLEANDVLELLLGQYVGASAMMLLQRAVGGEQVKMSGMGDKGGNGIMGADAFGEMTVCRQDFMEVSAGSG